MGHRKTKDEIINFVLNSPEEANSKVAIFIAGMQAQKNLSGYRRKAGRCSFAANRDGVSMVKK